MFENQPRLEKTIFLSRNKKERDVVTMSERVNVMRLTKENEVLEIVTSDDLGIQGVLYVGDNKQSFECGPVTCGGSIIGGGLNAGSVKCNEHFLVKTANLHELNVGGDVEAEYILCEGGAFVLGDINVGTLVSATHPVFCGGKFTGKFEGDPEMLHEQFTDWANLAKYL